MTNILKYVGVVALLIGVFALVRTYPAAVSKTNLFGATGGMLAENYEPYVRYNGGFNSALPAIFSGGTTLSGTNVFSGATSFTSTATFGTSGTAVSGVNFGTCAMLAYATTIAASSTATVDCSSTGRIGGTLTGVTSGDNVMAMATTSISSTFLGVKILGAHASTTPGYLTLTLSNETGDTFTWTGTASSTIAYRAVR